VHPGAILREVLQHKNKAAIARRLRIRPQTLQAILMELPVSAKLAIGFADLIGTSPELLMGLQTDFNRWAARN
jgi:plasmid maintenance system antidote protein VapI